MFLNCETEPRACVYGGREIYSLGTAYEKALVPIVMSLVFGRASNPVIRQRRAISAATRGELERDLRPLVAEDSFRGYCKWADN